MSELVSPLASQSRYWCRAATF